MDEFFDTIKKEKPTLVDFYATWCGPCKMQSSILEQLKERVGDKCTIMKIDIDRNPDLAAQFKVLSVPTLMLFKNGETTWRVAGVQPLETLEAKIDEHSGKKCGCSNKQKA